jgi:hypothetical protein
MLMTRTGISFSGGPSDLTLVYRPSNTVRVFVLVGVAVLRVFFAIPELRAQDSCWTEKGRAFAAGSREAVIEKSVSFLIQAEKLADRPYWPKGNSGITIGVGWDLGYHSAAELKTTWSELRPEVLGRLEKAAGIKGQQAQALLPQMRSVLIPESVSLTVFRDSLVRQYYPLVLQMFPQIEKLPTNVQVAFISVLFNRGPVMGHDPDWRIAKDVDRRWEIRRMRDDVNRQDFFAIYAHLGTMKRLWENAGPRGLLIRRRDEQALIRPYVNRQLEWEQKQETLKNAGLPKCPN